MFSFAREDKSRLVVGKPETISMFDDSFVT